MANRLGIREKMKLTKYLRSVMEPMEDEHDPELGCRYLSGWTDRHVAEDASAELGFEITKGSVAALRGALFGEVQGTKRRGPQADSRLDKVEEEVLNLRALVTHLQTTVGDLLSRESGL